MLDGIPPAPRGTPQIEVTFDINADGIVEVSAKDLGTGKTQKITISGQGSLNEDEINRMVNDAEKFAEEDERKRKEIETINKADSMTYQLEKLIKDSGDKIDGAKKTEAEELIEKVRKAIERKDIVEIESLSSQLEKLAQEIGAAFYAQQGGPEGAGSMPGAGSGPMPGAQSSDSKDDDVIDVEYDIDEN